MTTGVIGEQAGCGSSGVQPGSESVLRLDLRLARQLAHDEQLRQCIDHLENPSVLVAEVRSAIETTTKLLSRRSEEAGGSSREGTGELLLTHFPPGREISLGAPASAFRSLGSEVVVLPEVGTSESFDGIDYVGQLCADAQVLVLGTVESACDASPYLLLLRALSGLIELSLAFQHGHLPGELAHGVGEAACFDLHLVVSRSSEHQDALISLTRDLAENVCESLQRHFADLGLRHIHLARMDDVDFAGHLELEWTV